MMLSEVVFGESALAPLQQYLRSRWLRNIHDKRFNKSFVVEVIYLKKSYCFEDLVYLISQ